ncbi:MAG: sigma-70 family RNA polymerase sigma factor [Deferribacteres bacterium]|nr:sigma-70 family RNA polymerase sigma factor [candidate division KSB1 bacterium]MCB9503797.1 sigma-70 family RNA polymerase sigma factor [Deferribacteres bacterium]
MDHQTDSTEFIRRLKNKDKHAFHELVEKYQTRIYNLGLKMLINREDAEDILQETFIKIFDKIDAFREESELSTWIYRIATNAALMKLRERQRINNRLTDLEDINLTPVLPSRLLPDGRTPFDDLLNKESRSVLDEAIESLPDIYRVVFILKDVEQLETTKIAEILNLSHEAIYSRLKRARIQLRNAILQVYEDHHKESKHAVS